MIVDKLVKTYPNGFTALKGVSFETPDSGFICITGESGSGKTTLLNCLFGAEECEGKIVICGEEMTKKNRDELRRKYMTMIYQDYRLIEDMTVEDNLRLAGDSVGIGLTDDDILNALAKVGLKAEYRMNKVSAMSGGEKQRVGIARAIIQKSKILLADEPTGNLDSVNSRAIFELLKELSKEILILAVTHNATLADEFADYAITMMDGEIAKTNLVNIESKKNEESIENDINVNNNSIIRKTKVSGKLFFTLARQTGKSKIITILLSIFTVVFLALSFISSSLLYADEYHIERGNIKSRPEHAIQMSGSFPFAKESFSGINEDIYYSFYSTCHFWIDWYDYENKKKFYNEDSIYIKFYDYNNAEYTIECNDVANVGAKLICGRNVENYNEIVINESFAYACVSRGLYKDKIIKNYNDVLGIQNNNGMTVVGIVDAKFDKYKGEYANSTIRDFINASRIEQKKLIQAKSILENNIDSKINFVKEGYSEHTRNMLTSENYGVRSHAIEMIINQEYNYYRPLLHEGHEYYALDGSVSTKAPSENEIIISKDAYDELSKIMTVPSEPFNYDFTINEEIINLKVIGVSDKDTFVNNSVYQKTVNTNKEVFEYVFISSNMKLSSIDKIMNTIREITPNGYNTGIKSGYSYKLNDVAQSIENNKLIFIILFAVSVVLLLLFSAVSAYITLKQRREDILKMRTIGMDKKTLCLVYIVAFAVLAIIQIALAAIICGVVISAINNMIMNTLTVSFHTLFFEALPIVLISLSTIVTASLFTIRYLAVLFSKSIGFRRNQT